MSRTDALARLAYAARTKTEAGDSFWAMLDDALVEADVSDADAASAGGLSAATVARRKAQLRKEGKL